MATGFLYDAASSARVNSRRNFLAIGGGVARLIEIGEFDLTTAAGAQAITGVGFVPQLVGIIGLGLQPGESRVRNGGFHVGFAAGGAQWGGSVFGQDNAFNSSNDRHGYWRDDRIVAMKGGFGELGTAMPDFVAELTSFDADGFTLTKETAPTSDRHMVYIAMRGAGGYKVGTVKAPNVAGIQAVSGLGFLPGGMFFANGRGPLLQSDHEWIGLGAGDFADQFSVWCGARKGLAFLSARNDTGDCVTFAESSTGSGGAGRQVVKQAALYARTSDSFSLNWHTADAVDRYYHYVAWEGEADCDRFLYDPAANDKLVATTIGPRAIIGFGNDQIEEDWEPTRTVCSVQMSVANEDGSEEHSLGTSEQFPSGLNISHNNRHHVVGRSFGAFAGGTTTFSGNPPMRDLCDIVQVIAEPAQVGMNWRYAQRHGVATRALVGES